MRVIGLAHGRLLVQSRNYKQVTQFVARLIALESEPQTSINSSLLIKSSRLMLIAHAKLNYFRGVIHWSSRVPNESLAFQLLECLVRATLDQHLPWRSSKNHKFILEVALCSLALSD